MIPTPATAVVVVGMREGTPQQSQDQGSTRREVKGHTHTHTITMEEEVEMGKPSVKISHHQEKSSQNKILLFCRRRPSWPK